MHYSHVVAIPGDVEPDNLRSELELRMSRYGDDQSDDEVLPEWDWWVVGGRWGGEWRLKPGCVSGLPSEPSSFGFPDEVAEAGATDCARVGDLVAESIDYVYSYLDLDCVWHTKWLGPEGSGSTVIGDWERGPEFEEQFLKFLASLDPSAWLVHVDYHN